MDLWIWVQESWDFGIIGDSTGSSEIFAIFKEFLMVWDVSFEAT